MNNLPIGYYLATDGRYFFLCVSAIQVSQNWEGNEPCADNDGSGEA